MKILSNGPGDVYFKEKLCSQSWVTRHNKKYLDDKTSNMCLLGSLIKNVWKVAFVQKHQQQANKTP